MNYFSSDWHLQHRNILTYDPRPFNTIEEHDETIINNYNSTVKAKDNFYFLGDFAFCHDDKKIESYLSRLGGNKFFIRGNHDHTRTRKLFSKYGTYLGEQSKVKIEGQEIVLNHYKMYVWDKKHHGTWHLYGHSHGTAEHFENGKSFDVGINCSNYFPIEFSTVKNIIDKRVDTLNDHHDKR